MGRNGRIPSSIGAGHVGVAGGIEGLKCHPMGKKELPKLSKKAYEAELKRLQAELVEMQQWVVETGARVVTT